MRTVSVSPVDAVNRRQENLQEGNMRLLVWGCGLVLDPSLYRPSSTESGPARQAGKRCPPPLELQVMEGEPHDHRV